ncbi:MAG: hypothetical protein PHX16_04165 [Syntrophaceticus sp.]|jgi:hypothetical protein|nr:hypothetical protein [Syntrophaceticus sp.]MDD3315711.1 hypothetical protein [Syntrophaceticus sp.]MDD4359821.1 hypothetical protein [Syntrophaceticus sp.]MDD4782822.1 hypothetical protein [Syntrophaceticus sp.]
MAIAWKEMERKAEQKHLKLVPHHKAEERVEYEYPYDDLYYLYNYIMEEKKKTK